MRIVAQLHKIQGRHIVHPCSLMITMYICYSASSQNAVSFRTLRYVSDLPGHSRTNVPNVGCPNIPASELRGERFKTCKMMIDASRDSSKCVNFNETCREGEKLSHVIVTFNIAFIWCKSYRKSPKYLPIALRLWFYVRSNYALYGQCGLLHLDVGG